jgi:predicted nucleotidyltransferase component of viral defense system
MTRERDRASAASIRARLLNRAKRDGEELQRTLVLYGNERVLYRLSRSAHVDAFVLKGASLFLLWNGRMPRATKDIDLLGIGAPDPSRLREVFREILSIDVEPDGLAFDLPSVNAEPIREDSIYDGVRVTFRALLGTARLALQVDVGFGDAVEPVPELVDYPTLLASPAPRLRAYRREVLIAEKFHAMVTLGLANSRMKDYFDIAFLAERFSFEGADLARAIQATFARRQTPLPAAVPFGLTEEFALDPSKRTQWVQFGRRVQAGAGTLDDAVALVRSLVWPAAQAAAAGRLFDATWNHGRWDDVAR